MFLEEDFQKVSVFKVRTKVVQLSGGSILQKVLITCRVLLLRPKGRGENKGVETKKG